MFRKPQAKAADRRLRFAGFLGLLAVSSFLVFDLGDDSPGTGGEGPRPGAIGKAQPRPNGSEDDSFLPPPAKAGAPGFGAGEGPPAGKRSDTPMRPGLREMEQRMLRSTEGLTVVEHPDGRRSLNLGGRFFHMSAIVVGEDGLSRAQCFSSYRDFEEALQQSSAGIPAPALSSNEKQTDY